MAGLTVDGNDPLAVYAAAREAVDRARAGQGPTLIEAMTYRLQGHNMGDNESYIPVEEKKAAIERDPVPLFRTKLIAGGMVGAEELERMETQINREVEQAIELALDSPFPDLSELRKDVFAQEVVQ
jgi:pyruvate dehydrogenase E1 component alpha subunit